MSNQDIISTLAHHLKTLPVRKFNDDVKKAAVACVIRCVPPSTIKNASYTPTSIADLPRWLNQDWVKNGQLEVLFMKRAFSPRDRWSGNVAFPGGKVEKDETDKEAAMRECWEEVGLEINNSNYLCLGELDQREIRSLQGRKPFLIMCCYVFLQLTPSTPSLNLNPKEVASVHWMSLDTLLQVARDTTGHEIWKSLDYDIATLLGLQERLKSWKDSSGIRKSMAEMIEKGMSAFFGQVKFGGIVLQRSDEDWEMVNHPDEAEKPKEAPILWGLTLWCVSDLLDLVCKPDKVPPQALHSVARPRFTSWDVTMFLDLFHGKPEDLEVRKPMKLASNGQEGELVPNDDGTIGEFASPKTQKMSYPIALRLAVLASLVFRITSSFILLRALKWI